VLNIYAIKTKMPGAELQKYIVKADAGFGLNKQPALHFQFDGPGARIWERITAQNKGRWLAIIIDNKVISAPRVNDAVYGSNCSISSDFKPEETELLARQLNAGFMPAHLSIVEQDISVEKYSSAR
jgi:preprotein translocase subunit SecD